MNHGNVNSQNRLGRRISSLIGVSVLSVVSSVSMAAIVDSGAVNISVPPTTAGVYLNVVTNVNGVTPAAVPGWDINPFRTGTGFQFFFPSAPASTQGCVLAGADCASLTAGTTVGPASTFSASGSVSGLNFRTTGDRFVGFRFQNEVTAAVNYGFAEIRSTTNADPANAGFPASIIRYVYDNAGVPIVVAPAGPPPGAELALTQSNNAAGNALLIGNTFQKTLTVTNNGPSAATGITVSDTLPAQLAFVSSNCGATAAGQVVTYTIATLANAASSSCILTVRVQSSGTIINTASITASAPADPTPANNTTTAQIGPTGGGIAQTPVPALDLKSVLVLLGLVSALGMLALRQRQA